MNPARPVLRRLGILVALACGAAAVAPAAAQEAGGRPLSKSELVRLLLSDAYAEDEKLEILRANCVSFVPTDADRADFRALGAEPRLVRALLPCGGETPLQIRAPAEARAAAGDSVALRVTVRRGVQPRPGVRVRALSEDASPVTEAVTDPGGAATLRVAAGRRTVVRVLRLRAEEGDREADATVRLRVVAAEPAAARLTPRRLEAAGDAESDRVLRAVVEDRFGNPVPGRRVVLRAGGAGAPEIAAAETDDAGEAILVVPVARIADSAVWSLRWEETALAELPVRRLRAEDPTVAGAPDRGGRDPGGEAGHQGALEKLLRRGETRLAAGEMAGADSAFRAALRMDPRAPRAQEGLGRAALAAGNAREARTWFTVLTRERPEHPGGWEGLGRARLALGDVEGARAALERAVELDPDQEEARTALARLRSAPTAGATVAAWGGGTVDDARPAGLRRAELSVRLSAAVRLGATWDDGLARSRPALIRGRDPVEAGWVTGRIAWSERFAIRLQAGRRDQGFDLVQNVYGLGAEVRLGRSVWSGGGYVGRWFDRDDWLAWTAVDLPVGDAWTLRPSLWTGETVGTALRELGRHADHDTRIYLEAERISDGGTRFDLGVGLGAVRADDEVREGALWEAEAGLEIPFADVGRLLLFARHQSPPGSDSFTALGAGLGWTVGADRRPRPTAAP